MVDWITKNLGVKSARSKLKAEEYGSIIVDLRNVNDGPNDTETVVKTYNKVITCATVGKQTNTKIILQCEAGMSRSCAFACALFVRASDMEWEDAIDFVKKKVPQCQMNLDLIDSLKEVLAKL